MKQNKIPLMVIAAIAAILLSSLTTFALPPAGGGAECPDRCKTSDPTCCVTPGGSHYYGTLVQN